MLADKNRHEKGSTKEFNRYGWEWVAEDHQNAFERLYL